MGHRAWGTEHGAQGMGRRAWGTEHGAQSTGRRAWGRAKFSLLLG